jgi:uncharacterized membrane protein
MASLMELLEREVPDPVVIPAATTPTPDEEPDPLEEEVLKVADRADKVFGYDRLAKNIREKRKEKLERRAADLRGCEERRQQAILQAEAREVLAKLDIVPYSNESVAKYKAAVVDKAEDAYYLNELARIVSGIGIPIFLFAAMLFGSAASTYKMVTIWDHLALYSFFAAIGSIVFSIVLVFVSTKTPGRWGTERHARNGWPGYHWVEEDLHRYDDEAEVAALIIALQIHAELPSADFHVEVLRQKPTPEVTHYSPYSSASAWDGDPFLVLRVAGEDHYLAVWGEPDFERQQHP